MPDAASTCNTHTRTHTHTSRLQFWTWLITFLEQDGKWHYHCWIPPNILNITQLTELHRMTANHYVISYDFMNLLLKSLTATLLTARLDLGLLGWLQWLSIDETIDASSHRTVRLRRLKMEVAWPSESKMWVTSPCLGEEKLLLWKKV